MVDEGDGGQCGPTRLVQTVPSARGPGCPPHPWDSEGGPPDIWAPPPPPQAQRRRDLEEELRDLSNQVAALGRSLAEERGRSLAAGGALRALEIAVGGAQARVGGAYRARDRACERLRQQQAVAAAQRARRRAEQQRRDMDTEAATLAPPGPAPAGGRDPGALEAALAELREHNRALQQRLHQRQGQAEELRRALAAAGARAREAAGARARLEQEQRVLRGRLQHPGAPPGPTEAALRARCLHLQELLSREAGARAALGRAARAAGRRLQVLLAEVEEQRLRGERYRLQAQATEASGRALGERVAAVAAGTARAQAQGHRLRRALEAVGDGAAATARHVAALRARLRCDPLTLSRTVRRMLRGEDEEEDSEDSEDSGSPPWALGLLLETASGSWGGLETAPKEPRQKAAGPGGGLETAPSPGGSLETAPNMGGAP
ncbi:myosin-14 isoform X4 [Athene noctua]|uniref:myosin-14 isoform X4 n=1 Tax=Athene noctua TaxID=126797 RepID=UPI003EB8391A